MKYEYEERRDKARKIMNEMVRKGLQPIPYEN